MRYISSSNLLHILYLINTKCSGVHRQYSFLFLTSNPTLCYMASFLYSSDKRSQSECNCITSTTFTPYSIFLRIKVRVFLIETRMQTGRMLNSIQLSRLPGRKSHNNQQNPSPDTPKHWILSMKIYHTRSIMTKSITSNLIKTKLHSSLNRSQIFTFQIKHISSNKEEGETTGRNITYCSFINTDPRS